MTAFNGRRIAITGGGGGIGRAIGHHLASLGAEVTALDVTPPADLPGGATGMAIDLRSADSVRSAVATLYAQSNAPVHLVNAAGIVENDVAAEDIPIDLYDAVMAVNLRGVFLTCQGFGRELLARGGGSIVNIASMSGTHLVNFPQRQAIYNASKAGVAALTRSLAVEWAPRGVRVNTLSPGYVDTPLNHLKAHMHEDWMRGTMLNRLASPQEVAMSVEFLLDETRSGYYVGAELLMDGGSSLR